MASNDPTQRTKKQPEISVFDVKELYDMAYDFEKSDEGKFKTLLAEAVKLDMVYRRQLAQQAMFKDTTKKKSFNAAGDKTKVA